ncbi:MAG TPA: OsmC family protein [Ktedonobacterales bacterium]|nr:OsmC family protein [Ktedonobacterales bacterium]
MARELEATVTLREGMAFSADSGSGHEIILDTRGDGGQNQGPSPMELLLMGTAGCTAMDVISILRKKRQDVTAYQVVIHGTRADTEPRVFTDITIEHIVTGHQVGEAAVTQAIDLSVKKYCGAYAMMSKTAHITVTHRILEARSE